MLPSRIPLRRGGRRSSFAQRRASRERFQECCVGRRNAGYRHTFIASHHQQRVRALFEIDILRARPRGLIHLPNPKYRIARPDQLCRWMQHKTELRMSIRRNIAQPPEIERRRVSRNIGLIDRPLESRDVRKIRELARRHVPFEEHGQVASVAVDIASRRRVSANERVDRCGKKSFANQAPDDRERRSKCFAVVAAYIAGVDSDPGAGRSVSPPTPSRSISVSVSDSAASAKAR